MATRVSDLILDRLAAWHVRRIYGYPGDGINGLTSALRRAGDRFDFVQVRHEESAAFMACAHAKFGGGLGVCMVTSGPGAIHAMNGLYDARLDHQPVLAIVGQQPTTLLIVGGRDPEVVRLNQQAQTLLAGESRLEIVPGATHLFEEPGALEQVAALARDWFVRHLREARDQ